MSQANLPILHRPLCLFFQAVKRSKQGNYISLSSSRLPHFHHVDYTDLIFFRNRLTPLARSLAVCSEVEVWKNKF
jgi:hypothetical protein